MTLERLPQSPRPPMACRKHGGLERNVLIAEPTMSEADALNIACCMQDPALRPDLYISMDLLVRGTQLALAVSATLGTLGVTSLAGIDALRLWHGPPAGAGCCMMYANHWRTNLPTGMLIHRRTDPPTVPNIRSQGRWPDAVHWSRPGMLWCLRPVAATALPQHNK